MLSVHLVALVRSSASDVTLFLGYYIGIHHFNLHDDLMLVVSQRPIGITSNECENRQNMSTTIYSIQEKARRVRSQLGVSVR